MKVHPVYSSEDVLMFSYKTAIDIIDKNIEGDFVECGVAAGSQIGAMQQALLDKKTKRKIWAFDSFEGIPYASKEDTEQPGIGKIDMSKIGLLETTGISSNSIDDVIDNFRKWDLPIDNINFVKGWFQDTIEPTSKNIDKISILRLDGDLYESTLIPLKFLYDKVVDGGIIIIDDWNLDGCKKAVKKFIHHKKIKMFNEIAYVIK